MCGSGIPGLIYWWDQSPSYGIHTLGCLQHLCAMLHAAFRFHRRYWHPRLDFLTAAIQQSCSFIPPSLLRLPSLSSIMWNASSPGVPYVYYQYSSVQDLIMSVIPLNRVVMFPGMLSNGGLLQLPFTAWISVLIHSGLQLLDDLSYVCLSTWKSYPIYYHGLFLQW